MLNTNENLNKYPLLSLFLDMLNALVFAFRLRRGVLSELGEATEDTRF